MTITAPHSTAAASALPVSGAEAAQDRQTRKLRLAAVLRLFARLGFEFGTDGHISVRDPELPGHLWINPFGVAFSRVRVSDLVLVGPDDAVVEGAHRPHPGLGFHRQLHTRRADAEAVVHVHSPYGLAFSSVARRLDPVNQDSALLFGLQGVYDEYGVRGDTASLGAAVAAALGERHRVLIQRHHGFVTIGDSLDEAAFYFVAAERAARAQLLLESTGRLQLIPDDVAARVALTPEHAARHLQPSLQQIVHDQPDLLA